MRFLLDSDVVSEPLREQPNPKLLEKMSRFQSGVATAATVIHELRYGACLMPPSRRRARIEAYLARVAQGAMTVLPYTAEAADWHAVERARLEQSGEAVGVADGQIAAVAKVNGLILVTRNVSHFSRFSELQVVSWH